MFRRPVPLPFRPRNDFLVGDDGMTTVEYCVGLIAAAALAVVLYGIVTGDDVHNSITSIVKRALTVKT